MTLSSASSGARRIRFVFLRDTEDALNIIIILMQLNTVEPLITDTAGEFKFCPL
jgi:hypothetical protein